jgi:hypothetical protein
MYLPVAGDSGDLRLTPDFETFVAPGHESVTVRLLVDGVEAVRWMVGEGEPPPELAVVVPAQSAQDGVLELLWEVDFPVVPYQFGDPAEKREVGVLLRSILVEPSHQG